MLRALALSLMLSGCSAFGPTVAACKVVDTVTTFRASAELNPLVRALLHASPVLFVAAQVAFVAAALHYEDRLSDEQKAATLIVACLPAAHNVLQ